MELLHNGHGRSGGPPQFSMVGPDALSKLRELPARTARGAVRIYSYVISPLLGPNCRHLPGCSEYAEEALGRFGLWAGGWMTLARLLRCHPLGTSGLDFVPHRLPAGARWWVPWRYGRWRGTNPVPPADAAP
jgi:putative membrane protein insertion efficiency factor